MTDLKQFAALAAEMRHAQKEYFRTRSPAALESSKRLEKAVDRALLEISQPQQGLFGEEQ